VLASSGGKAEMRITGQATPLAKQKMQALTLLVLKITSNSLQTDGQTAM
jgi:hypothetical protein